MAAGFEGDVGGGTAGALAGLAQRMDLGMRLAGAYVPALTDQFAIGDDDATDPWVRMGRIKPLARQLQRPGHPGVIGRHSGLAGSRDSRSISSRNSLRSWKRR